MHPIDTTGAPVRLALIGFGPWGRNLFRELDSLPEASVVAVCDLDESRLRQAEEMTPRLVATTHLESVLEDGSIDGVLVATPCMSHFDVARLALRAGKHVYVEKLLGTTAEQARKLDDLARSKGRALMVGHVCVHDTVVEQLAREIRDGTVGAVRHVRSVRTALGRIQPDVNVVWDLLPHDLSMLQIGIGRLPDEVAVHAAAVVGAREELATVHMSYDDGPSVEISLSWLDSFKQRRWTVIGERGSLAYDALAPSSPLTFRGGTIEQRSVDGEPHYSYQTGESKPLSTPRSEHSPLRRLGRHFVTCMQSGRLPLTGGPEGAAVLAVLEACDRSLAAAGLRTRVRPRHPARVVGAAEMRGQ